MRCPGSHPKAHLHLTSPYDSVNHMGARDPLELNLPEYRVAIAAAIQSSSLTAAEGCALVAVFVRIGLTRSADEIESACRRNLTELGAATTVERATRVAAWTYFDPATLRRASARKCSG